MACAMSLLFAKNKLDIVRRLTRVVAYCRGIRVAVVERNKATMTPVMAVVARDIDTTRQKFFNIRLNLSRKVTSWNIWIWPPKHLSSSHMTVNIYVCPRIAKFITNMKNNVILCKCVK